MGRKARDIGPVERVTLEQLVPADHRYRHLERQLDPTFVRARVAERYASGGRRSCPPHPGGVGGPG